ncbi:hypothetical protein F5Y18DRAFT_368397 [Xylariaceae sp. FL1019]|nr:hypothetical protein F5Y18DRAFT_368397 [Xylariaceae sp. FL1019]
MLLCRAAVAPACRSLLSKRCVSTLTSNPHIKAFPNATGGSEHLITYLDTNPPNPELAIGSSTELPPTTRSFKENHRFTSILNEVLKKYAAQDPSLQAQAQAFAGPGGATFGSHGVFPQQRRRTTKKASAGGETGAGGASAQGGAGGAGVGGHVHLSDARNPPDFGRIAWPEDILGSIEVDGHGTIVGEFEPSGTYRIITNEGILGLSDFLRTKLVEQLKQEEKTD